jgi:hypothetical protein
MLGSENVFGDFDEARLTVEIPLCKSTFAKRKNS